MLKAKTYVHQIYCPIPRPITPRQIYCPLPPTYRLTTLTPFMSARLAEHLKSEASSGNDFIFGGNLYSPPPRIAHFTLLPFCRM